MITSDNAPLLNDSRPKQKLTFSQRLKFFFIYFCMVSSVLIVVGLMTAAFLITILQGFTLQESIKAANMMNTLQSLQDIAMRNPSGSRSVATGYNASADFIISMLQKQTKCLVWTQNFQVPLYVQNQLPTLVLQSPYSYPFQHGVDFQQFRYGGSGIYNGTYNIDIIPISSSGCEPSDFPNSQGKLVVMAFVTVPCEQVIRALNAEKAGAVGILFYNTISSRVLSSARIRFVNWQSEGPMSALVQIPVISISYSLGQFLLSYQPTSGIRLSINSNTSVTVETTSNVVCELPGSGSRNDIIMAGAHLDSVPEGPGMVDNGSGSSSLLEIAVQFSKNINNYNTLRFAWWGAEEIGLLGSRYYVRELQKNATEFSKHVAYVNADMIASPNYVLEIYDGSTSLNPVVKLQSRKITDIFVAEFNATKTPYQLGPMVSGSDFVPFAEAGIPSGGLRTGAAGIKTIGERTMFGGMANAQHDPCYHQACDNVANVDVYSLELNAKMLANVLEFLSVTSDPRTFLNSTATTITP